MTFATAVETSRLPHALGVIGFDQTAARALAHELTEANADRLGRRVWQSMCGATMDDRPLYWMRLWIMHQARALGASETALTRFEHASRGRDFTFAPDVDKRVIVSGFDPFHLDNDIRQSNPSGIVALRLHNRICEMKGLTVAFKATIVPVRFADFDGGYIESLLTPAMQAQRFDLLTTISMGREQFDLERFPGRRRSAAQPDNAGRMTGATEANPLIPDLDGAPLAGPEFLEYSLPGRNMHAPGQFRVNVNNRVQTLERGTFEANTIADLVGQTAVNGSGGGYLSNEISYRTLRLAAQHGVTAPIGHIHTPRLVGYAPKLLEAIVAQAEQLIESAIA